MTNLLKEKEKERAEQRKQLQKIMEKERIAKIGRLAEGLFPRYPPGTVFGELREDREGRRRKK